MLHANSFLLEFLLDVILISNAGNTLNHDMQLPWHVGQEGEEVAVSIRPFDNALGSPAT